MTTEKYFLSIVLCGPGANPDEHYNGKYIYRLCKGRHIHASRVLFDISRTGAQKWFKENRPRLVRSAVRSNFDTVFFVNRAFELT
jgi:hypothetical protein